MQAVGKALEFLSSDEAHDLFTRTFNFLQRSVDSRLDAFEEVKKTIKSMIDKLLKEADDDIKHKDYCIDEFNTNEVDTANKQKELDGHKAKIEDLHMTVEELTAAI